MLVEVRDVSKIFQMENGEKKVLQHLNMTVEEGEFVCILGYTGSGKSTLLRLLSGLESVTSGQILVDQKIYDKPSKDVLMIFQDYNQLLPWKTVIENVMYPLIKKNKALDKKKASMIASQILEQVGLMEFLNYYPRQISGGMRQRVALARALVLNPRILLMDEPFAALDDITRQQLQNMCLQIFNHNKTTVVFVTHSIEEALTLADRIIVLDGKQGNVRNELINEVKFHPDQIELRMQTKAKIIKMLNNEKENGR